MKNAINSKTVPGLVVLTSLLGALFRLLTRGNGPDAGGLFEPRPVAWCLLWAFTAVTAVLIVYAVRKLRNPGTYRDNYPKSPGALVCSLPMAANMLITGVRQLRSCLEPTGVEMMLKPDFISVATGILGMVAGACLVLSGLNRIFEKKPFFLLNGLICLYFALRLFHHCRDWSNEPQLGIVVFPFLASLVMMLASYHRTCFDVEMGNRRMFLFWSLMGVYLSVVAMLSYEEPLFYGSCALWLLTDLCSLRPLRRKPASVQQPEAAPEESAPEEGA